MTNVDELEKRWIQYKIKSYLRDKRVLFLFIVILIVALFFSFNKTSKVQSEIKSSLHVEKKIKENEVLNDKKATKQETIKKKEVNKSSIVSKEKLVLSPSMSFMEKIDIKKTLLVKHKSQIKTAKEKTKIINAKNESINFKRTTSQSDIESVRKRFEQNNNPALSLFIAKKYYELGEYNKAYNYALITNKINNDIEDSWIIFAKSLVKFGEKEKALKTLNKYVNHSDSDEAQQLLREIISGEFK